MAQQFQFNGSNITHGIEANWDEIPLDMPLAGGTVFNRFRRHSWQAGVLTAAEFVAMRAQLGKAVSLTTTDYSDRNSDFVTYYGATLDRLSGEHSGPVYVGVSAEFTARV